MGQAGRSNRKERFAMYEPQRTPPILPLDADPDVYRWANEPYAGPITRRGLVWLGLLGLVAAFWGGVAYLVLV